MFAQSFLPRLGFIKTVVTTNMSRSRAHCCSLCYRRFPSPRSTHRSVDSTLLAVRRSLLSKTILLIARPSGRLAAMILQRRSACHQRYTLRWKTTALTVVAAACLRAGPKQLRMKYQKALFRSYRCIGSLRSDTARKYIASRSTDVKPQLSVLLCTSSSFSQKSARTSFVILTSDM
jgi:hypothetical protein